MKNLPDHVQAYKRTKTFTQDTVPKGLLKDHSTAEGTWGLILVLEGKLEYTIGAETHLLNPELSGVVEPTMVHHIKPVGNVTFYVEFYK